MDCMNGKNFLSAANMPFKPIIFCDFDGTITTTDTLVYLLDRYGDREWRKYEIPVKNGQWSTKQSLLEEFARFRATEECVKKHLENDIALDPHFREFLDFVNDSSCPFIILSGGFRQFISIVLSRHGISGIPYYANDIHFKGDRTTLSFPHTYAPCTRCAHPKTLHIAKARQEGFFPIVFIGDGTTDRCPVKYADIAFAKIGLANYCDSEGIPYNAWDTFRDIEIRLREEFAPYVKLRPMDQPA